MEKNRGILAEIWKYLVLFWIAVGFLAVCSLSTTPLLAHSYGQDSAFFLLVGQGMTAGKLPYRDFFDMKGPYLFLTEYLGQLLIPGRKGIFAIQCLLLFVTLVFANQIFNRMHPRGRISLLRELVLLGPAAYVLSFTMTGGNLTEELSLPWLMACLYFCLKYLRLSEIPSPKNQEHPLKWGFFYGFAFGVMCLIRITNAALIGAILLTISVNLILWGKWENLLLNGLCFLFGAAVAFLPACAWAEYHGILGQMLYQVFLFGSRYSGELSFLEKLRSIAGPVWPCIFGAMTPFAVLLVYRVKNWKYWMLSLSAFVLLMVAVVMGNLYCHYFVLGIPNLILAGAMMVRWGANSKLTPGKNRARAAIAWILILAAMAAQGKLFYERAFLEIRYAMYCAVNRCEETEQYDAIGDILARIPAGERDSVYVYGMSSCSNWYVQAGILPPNLYCDWQEHYIQLVPEIGDSLADWLAEGGAKWIVLEAGSEIQRSQIRSAMTSGYETVHENSLYQLLRYNSGH